MRDDEKGALPSWEGGDKGDGAPRSEVGASTPIELTFDLNLKSFPFSRHFICIPTTRIIYPPSHAVF